MSCVLRLSGKQFRVDDFLKVTKLIPYQVFRKGEVDSTIKKYKHKENGCYFETSCADFESLDRQIKDSIRFLKKHQHKFALLKTYGLKPADQPVLNFGIATRMSEVAVQNDIFPAELLLLCGSLGINIELSQYHTD